MTEKEAMKKLNQHKAELDKLNAEKDGMNEQLGTLKASRDQAVRLLAKGDPGQRKIILGLESKISDLSLSIEGLGHLIVESETTVNEANEDLKKAAAEENARLQGFIQEHERQDREKLISSLQDREKKIVALYHQLCVALAELQIDAHHFEQNGRLVQIKELADLAQMLPMKIENCIKENNLRPLISGGHFAGIRLWPYVASSSEISAAFPGSGLMYPEQIARVRREKRLQALTAEYQSSNK